MQKVNLYEVRVLDSPTHYKTDYTIAHCEDCARRKCRLSYMGYAVYYNRVTKQDLRHILATTSYEELHPVVKEYVMRREMYKAYQKLNK